MDGEEGVTRMWFRIDQKWCLHLCVLTAWIPTTHGTGRIQSSWFSYSSYRKGSRQSREKREKRNVACPRCVPLTFRCNDAEIVSLSVLVLRSSLAVGCASLAFHPWFSAHLSTSPVSSCRHWHGWFFFFIAARAAIPVTIYVRSSMRL